jgi:lipopolysaccharide/colanic/teichoic acid biosynthesis glycosyltransferase
MLIIAILIKIDSPGPALFRQKRWGQGCTVIDVLKFRTMRIELCDFSGICQTVEHDPRVTRLGSILRSTNLDELPQLFNVLRGDMSLVGPRCHAIGMLAAGMPYEELVPEYHIRHLVKPGITGMAQMRGLRGPTVDRDAAIMRFECDAYYVSNLSFWLDFKIMLETIRMEAFRGRGF